jgi:hypothetical protein
VDDDLVVHDGSDARAVLTRALACAAGDPEAVTADLSPRLLAAVAAGRDLPRVATIRVVPRPFTDTSLARLSAPLVERLVGARFTVTGGHDLRGNELRPIDTGGLAGVCEALATTGIRTVGVVGAGSQARPDHERAVADAVQAAVPGARISIASEYGGQGLAAREATVVLDLALAPLVQGLVDQCEEVLERTGSSAQLRLARGDGGCSPPSRIRPMPVLAVGATAALQLTGAAWLAGRPDCRVLLPPRRPGGRMRAGEVRDGLAVVGPTELPELGAGLVVPTALLTHQPAVDLPPHRSSDQPVVHPRRCVETLACVGAAVSCPAAWSDDVAFIESAAQFDAVRKEAVARTTAFVMSNGAAPGSARLAHFSAVALPYSPPGTVRIRVRVVGEPDRRSST